MENGLPAHPDVLGKSLPLSGPQAPLSNDAVGLDHCFPVCPQGVGGEQVEFGPPPPNTHFNKKQIPSFPILYSDLLHNTSGSVPG